MNADDVNTNRTVTRQAKEAAADRAESIDHPAVKSEFRVLLAEDTEINRQLIRALLQKLGCTVDIAGNGLEAVELVCRGNQYDLILMDCMMPEMDGYEATMRLRAREADMIAPRTPILALTASAIDGDRERCIEAGMDDYLAKPFTASEFATAVGRWIRLNNTF